MQKRGPIIAILGLILVVVSLSIMISVLPADVTESKNFYIPSMFKGVFNQVSDHIQILPGESGYFSYTTKSFNTPLLWGLQIIDYHDGDKLSVSISNIYSDNYGIFSQDTAILFEMLENTKSDTLNFEIQNHGSKTINVVVMISEDPDNSDALSNPNSNFMKMVLPLVLSAILLILGIIILLIGIILYLLNWRNIQNNKRNY